MMLKRFSLLFGFLLLLPHVLHGQDEPASTPAARCVEQINLDLLQQERVARQILFGLPDAATEAAGTIRYDQEGTAWTKTPGDEWRLAGGGENAAQSNDDMNEGTEWPGMNEVDPANPEPEPQQGIFETKRALTSELLPGVLQTFRGLQCRTAAVCEGLRQLRSGAEPDEDGMLTVSTPGCQPLRVRAITQCVAPESEEGGTGERAAGAMDESVVQNECEPAAEDLRNRFAELLTLAIAYDASYRSLLQFSGNFDRFLGEFKGDLLSPIEQAMPLISQLARIPCFLSQCQQSAP